MIDREDLSARNVLAHIRASKEWTILSGEATASPFSAWKEETAGMIADSSPEDAKRFLSMTFSESADVFLNGLKPVIETCAGVSPPYFAVLPTNSANAILIVTPTGDRLCIIGIGLMSFIHAWAEGLSELTIADEAPVDIRHYGKVMTAAALFLAGARSDDVMTALERPANSSQTRFWWTSQLVLSMTLFVLLHEVAHHKLGHLSERERLTVRGPSGEYFLEILSRHRKDELKADEVAYEDFLQAAEGGFQNLALPREMACAPLLFLEGLSLAERISPSRLPEELKTHPPSRDRVDRLMPLFNQKACGEAREYLLATSQVLEFFRVFTPERGPVGLSKGAERD